MSQSQSNNEVSARNSLPDVLRPVFDSLVADYKYFATLRHGRPYVSYVILADMIRAGWRLSEKPLK